MIDSGESPLARTFRRLIAQHGPMPVSRYMGESNARYYSTRDPLGAAGDFTTAPEISQMFGEMAGLWLADIWVRAGRPADAIYVELGPGRGTLAKDALRAMASQGLRPEVHLIEGSQTLRKLQDGAVAGAHFHDTIDSIPEGRPVLLLANEFLDALPIRQLVMTEKGWRERLVGIEDGAFAFVSGPNAMDDAVPEDERAAPEDTVIETCPAAAALVEAISRRIDVQGGAALFIDYGYVNARTGSTLQAVKSHQKLDVFDLPGEMDLTAHVDFATLDAITRREGVASSLTTQGAWLAAMGIDLRAQALSRAYPSREEEIKAAVERLVRADAMGELFKCLAITARDWPRGAAFPEGERRKADGS